MSSRRTALLLALAAALLAAGCGDDDEETATVTETTTAETTTGPDEELTGLGAVSTPDGNIGCFIDRSRVRCDIAERDWEPPAPPEDCELDYGQGIELRAGTEPAFVCAGDSTLDVGPPLGRGESFEAGLLRCEIERSGVTCRDIESGRGFTLSRERYELF